MRSTALASLLGCVLVPACADQQESLIVLRAPAWNDGECLVDPTVDVGMLEGVLDITQGTAYLLPMAVLNNLQTQNSDSSNAGIVTNEIQLRNADVDLTSDDGPDVIPALGDDLTSFRVTLASDSVPPGEPIGVAVEVISRAASEKLLEVVPMLYPGDVQIHILATVVIHGTRSGNTVGKIGIIDAREFTFPIRICQGCLLDCRACEAIEDAQGNITSPEGECHPFENGDFVGGVCGNAQDFAYAPPTCDLEAP